MLISSMTLFVISLCDQRQNAVFVKPAKVLDRAAADFAIDDEFLNGAVGGVCFHPDALSTIRTGDLGGFSHLWGFQAADFFSSRSDCVSLSTE